jgi:hypothetical protein
MHGQMIFKRLGFRLGINLGCGRNGPFGFPE